MDDSEVNNLIDRKILEAKLIIAEKRVGFLIFIAGGLLAIFGIAIPIWQTTTSTNKVDKAIEEMRSELKEISQKNEVEINKYSEDVKSKLNDLSTIQSNFITSSSDKVDKEIQSIESRFKELAGIQLRKPVLICSYNGVSLNNSLIEFNKKKNYTVLKLENVGDASAKDVRIKLYIKTDENVFSPDYMLVQDLSDEPNFNIAYDYQVPITLLDAKDSKLIEFDFGIKQKKTFIVPAMLKIYYGQPNPVKYNFSIKYEYK